LCYINLPFFILAQSLSQKELDALAPDAQARTAALNFLLGTACQFLRVRDVLH
jgi:hypothetical protein